VARRELDALRRHQVDERIVLRRQVLVHGAQHVFIRVRSRHLEHLGMPLEDSFGPRAQAAGDDDLAVLFERFADRLERFVDGGVDEPAGVHHDHIRGVVRGRHLVTLGTQLRDDAFGIHECLRASETHESDFGLAAAHKRGAIVQAPATPCMRVTLPVTNPRSPL
jgi:hypothetical protein